MKRYVLLGMNSIIFGLAATLGAYLGNLMSGSEPGYFNIATAGALGYLIGRRGQD